MYFIFYIYICIIYFLKIRFKNDNFLKYLIKCVYYNVNIVNFVLRYLWVFEIFYFLIMMINSVWLLVFKIIIG